MTRRLLATLFVVAVGFALAARADDPAKDKADAKAKAAVKDENTIDPKVAKEEAAIKQQQLANQFREFETALLRLAQRLSESEKPEDKAKAAILRKALEKSSTEGLDTRFDRLIKELKGKDNLTLQELEKAGDANRDLANDIRAIIAILMSDNQDEELKRRIAELSDMLKRINQIIREQQTVRAWTERDAMDKDRLGREQQQVRQETEGLIKGQGKAGENREGKGDPKGQGRPGDSKEGKPGEAKNDTKEAKGDERNQEGKPGDNKEGKPGEAKEGKPGDSKENKPGDAKGGQQGGDPKESKPGDSKGGQQGGDPKESKPGDAKGGQQSGKEGKPGENKDGGKPDDAKENKPGEAKEAGKPGDDKDNKPGEAKEAGKEDKPGEPSKSGQQGQQSDNKGKQENKGDAKGQQSQSGSQGQQGQSKSQGQQGQQGQQGGAKGDPQQQQQQPGGNQQQQPNDNPAKKQIQDAVENQKGAEDKIKQPDNPAASDKQNQAIKNLQDAAKKLEDLLKQLRQEEIERILAALQARCERMLAMQIEVRDGTVGVFQTIDKLPGQKAGRTEEQKSLQLSDREEEIVQLATKAIDLLKSEGSAVAFPEVFMQLRDDMTAVANRLRKTDVGLVTQAIENDIIETLKEMIEALKKARQENQQQNQPPQPGQPQQGKPGDQKLIELLHELKMIRSMQVRVNDRTKLYGKEYPGEQAPAPNTIEAPPERDKAEMIQKELKNLSDREKKIFQVTNDIARGKNK